MARAGIGFRAGELLFAQVDLRLIPELDPIIGERLLELDLGGAAAGMPSLSSWMILTTASVSYGFLSTGSMWSLCSTPTLLTCSSTAAPRLLVSCTAPRKPRAPRAAIDSMASAESSETL